MINVFIIGSKGLPAKYGGYETFVDNLTKRKKDEHIRYFVSCMSNVDSEFEYNNAHCFSIKLKKDNALGRVLNVHKSLVWVEKFLKHNVSSSDTNIVYILGCRIGILMPFHKRKIKKLNCIIACNPDGLEWKRDKWNKIEKKLVLYAEKQLVKNSNYVICDSINIKSYIEQTYKDIETGHISYLAYGCDASLSSANENQMFKWLEKYDIYPRKYYLIIGRFVPENNYELMIREFMKSQTDKKLLIISNVQENAFYNKLIKDLHFEADKRIVFAGTLYDTELVKKIRENAFAYLHGHSVGGTNPSLLEAMASTKINLLYNVSFNKEVGAEQCLYFNDECGNLANLINYVENNYNILVKKLNPKSVVEQKYSWESIVNQYEQFFIEMSKK